MSFRKILLIAALAASPLAATEQAAAQCGGFGGYGGLGAYADVGNLYRVLSQNVPYYSAFPPVYYSYPVPRTYGHSPFAYLPSHVTPQYAAPAPLAVDNPYFQGSTVSTTKQQPVAKPNPDTTTRVKAQVAPLAVSNPYVRPQTGLVLNAAYGQ